jgi:hypothetical protein
MAKPKDFAAFFAGLQAEASDRQADHAKERVARGLSPTAGTGRPLPRIVFEHPTEEELGEIEYQSPKYAGLGVTQAIVAATSDRDIAVLDRLPIGASRFGGLPDLPPGIEWPRVEGKLLPFLAQVNLADLPASKESVLPSDGWLYVFGRFDNDHEDQPVAVLHHRGPATQLVRAARPAKSEVWPDWMNITVYEVVPLIVRPDTQSVGKGKNGRGSAGWFFGDDDGFGTAGEMADFAFMDGDDWINLLVLHSVGSMQWSDSGYLYLLIRQSHLASADFTHVFGAIRSS